MSDIEKLAALQEYEQLRSDFKLLFYKPYPKQKAFHDLGKTSRARCLFGANQSGKTLSAGNEVAMHLTGIYPEWWDGKRFHKPGRWWAAGISGESTRETAQRVLCGGIGQIGTGTIPKQNIFSVKMSRGVADALDTVLVNHAVGGISQLTFKTYEKGREKWQGDTLDGVWFDEEPPVDIYTEGETRTAATNGIILMTETPLLGMSDVVRLYLDDSSGLRQYVTMTIEDAEHFSPEERAERISRYLPHERDARAMGKPMLGSGAVFPFSQDMVSCEPFEIPKHWPRLNALDFGWDHPNAAVQGAWDRDNDVIYVVRTYRQSNVTPVVTAAAVRNWGTWVPTAWPHDGLQHDKGSGKQLAQLYREAGLEMLSEHAQFPDDRGFGLEAGLLEMYDRMQTGRLKVFLPSVEWFDEFRTYHRKDGIVVKERDDLLSATRYMMMCIRFALPGEAAPKSYDRYSKIRKRVASWMTA